jgi:hypothetical protein
MTGGFRKLHNEELHTLDSLTSIIRMVNWGRMRWTGHIAWRGMHVGYWWESQEEGNQWQKPSCKWMVNIWRDRMEWCGLDWSTSG